MFVPYWFRRALKIIDPKFYVVIDYDSQTYDIWKEVEIDIKTKFRWKRYKEHRMVAYFYHLNDSALADLRYRKWLGNKFETPKDPKKYWAWMRSQDKEEKKKKIEEARAMQAEGWVRIHNVGRRKMFT